MEIVRKFLSADEVQPPNTRYNPETNTVETTIDGGTTWVENPASDPRGNPAYLQPVNTAPDVQCAAAAGMVEDVRRVVGAATGGGGIVGVSGILLGILLLPIGWLVLAVLAAAGALVAAGAATIAADFTEEVYEALLCLFRCNIDADGRVSQAQLDTIYAQAGVDFPGTTVQLVVGEVFRLHGAVGLSNAGSLYADPGADCSECTCTSTLCVTFDDGDPYTIIPFGHGTTFADATLDTGFGDPAPSIIDGKGMSGSENGMGLAVEIDLGAAVHTTILTMDVYYERNDFDSLYVEIQYLNAAHGVINTSAETILGEATHWYAYGAPDADELAVRYIQIYVAGSSVSFTDGDCWLDNVCIEFSE